MAKKYLHKLYGWRVEYVLVFKDKTKRLKTRYAKEESRAKEILELADRLEALIREQKLSLSDVIAYQELKFIDKGDRLKLLSDNPISDVDVEILKLLQRISNKDKQPVLILLHSLAKQR